MRIALLCVFAIGCGSSPVAPSPVIPTITGQWTGTYRPTGCTETGAAVGSGFCGSIANGGGMVLTPQQTGGALTGTLAVGGFTVPVSGSVDATGVVVLAGSNPTALATLTITTWRGTLAGSSMTGSSTWTLITPSPLGTATVQATFALTR